MDERICAIQVRGRRSIIRLVFEESKKEKAQERKAQKITQRE